MNMKSLIIYSSITGNTKQVAEAIASAIPGSDLLSVNDNNLFEIITDKKYSLFIIGFFVDKGKPDEKVICLLRKLKEMITENENNLIKKQDKIKIAFFSTLGGDPQSDAAKKCMKFAEQLVSESFVISPSLIVRGKISPALLQLMHKNNPTLLQNKKHLENIEKAKTHPDINDLKDASIWARTIYENLSKNNQ